MAGVILTNSFAVAQSAAESRMRNRRWGGISLPTRQGRRRIASSFHSLGAAFCVALDDEPSPTAASSRLLVFSCMGAIYSRRPGRRAMLSALGRTFGAGAGFMPLYGRVD